MKIYDSLSRTKKPLKKPLLRKLKMFVCGPTVYDDIHLGNFRTYISFDMIARYLKYRGYNLFYLQNITDIDDKIIERAKKENISWNEIAQKYENIYYKNTKALNITSIDKYARATDYIHKIVKQVQTLIKKKNAYKIDGDGWYFDLKTFKNYGKLANRTVEQAEDGISRIDASDKKKNAGDFCLWKFAEEAKDLPTLVNNHYQKGFRLVDGVPAWQTALGWGRPGWHIEDTAISEYFFGPQYDLHGGGIDLKFPHHEAEIAQQESASGKKPFVRIWMHTGLLTVNGGKMSKSKGNFTKIEDFLKKNSGDVLRFMALLHHYRSSFDYTEEIAYTAKKNLLEIRTFIAKLDLLKNKKKKNKLRTKEHKKKFLEAMDDDFNTPKAIAILFNLMNEANKDFWNLTVSQSKNIKKLMIEILSTLGIKEIQVKISDDARKLAQERELSRKNQQFTQADDLRKKIEGLGYDIEDTPAGPLLLPK